MSRPDALIAALEETADPADVANVSRIFRGDDPTNEVMGVSIGKVFPIAKRFTKMALEDVEALLDDRRYEVRMAAVAILDFKARQKTHDGAQRRALFDLYLRRHDRINNWDLVDRAAPHVIGEYLVDENRSVLDRLAGSDDPHERRSALVATHAFIKRNQVADTFRIAGMLAGDEDEYVQKAIASWTREAGKRDEAALVRFLTEYKSCLPKPTVTAASKLLPADVRKQLRS
jgi:3-methyladenine DNA glycosylase AlkD